MRFFRYVIAVPWDTRAGMDSVDVKHKDTP
jgi:hypothetical protein